MLKFAVLLACVAFATAAHIPEERDLFGDLFKGLQHIHNPTLLKQDVQALLNHMGTDENEQKCESLVATMTHLSHDKSTLCLKFQDVVNHFNLSPQTVHAVGKRIIFGGNTLTALEKIIHLDVLKQHLQAMIDVIGGDPTEAQCEAEGNKLFTGLIQTAVPLVCRSFQSLVQQLHITPDPTTTAASV